MAIRATIVMVLLMDESLHHLGALGCCNSEGFRDLRCCKISSINNSTTNNNDAHNCSNNKNNSSSNNCKISSNSTSNNKKSNAARTCISFRPAEPEAKTFARARLAAPPGPLRQL